MPDSYIPHVPITLNFNHITRGTITSPYSYFYNLPCVVKKTKEYSSTQTPYTVQQWQEVLCVINTAFFAFPGGLPLTTAPVYGRQLRLVVDVRRFF